MCKTIYRYTCKSIFDSVYIHIYKLVYIHHIHIYNYIYIYLNIYIYILHIMTLSDKSNFILWDILGEWEKPVEVLCFGMSHPFFQCLRKIPYGSVPNLGRNSPFMGAFGYLNGNMTFSTMRFWGTVAYPVTDKPIKQAVL